MYETYDVIWRMEYTRELSTQTKIFSVANRENTSCITPKVSPKAKCYENIPSIWLCEKPYWLTAPRIEPGTSQLEVGVLTASPLGFGALTVLTPDACAMRQGAKAAAPIGALAHLLRIVFREQG